MVSSNLFERYIKLRVDEKYLLSLIANKYNGKTTVPQLLIHSLWAKNTFTDFLSNIIKASLVEKRKDDLVISDSILLEIKQITSYITIDDIKEILLWQGAVEIKEFCKTYGIKSSGTKEELVLRIINADLDIKDILSKLGIWEHLEQLCIVANINPKGTKKELINRIIEHVESKSIIDIINTEKKPEKDDAPKKTRIFISYATADSEDLHLKNFYQMLKNDANIRHIFFWEEDCKVSDSIILYMEESIKLCDLFIVFITNNSRNSKPVQLEIEMAIMNGKRILTVCQSLKDVREVLKTQRCYEYNDRLDLQHLLSVVEKLISI